MNHKRIAMAVIAGVGGVLVAAGFLDPETAQQVWMVVQDLLPATE